MLSKSLKKSTNKPQNDEQTLYAEKTFDNKLGQVRLVDMVDQNEVRATNKPKTNDLGYLLSKGNQNKFAQTTKLCYTFTVSSGKSC